MKTAHGKNSQNLKRIPNNRYSATLAEELMTRNTDVPLPALRQNQESLRFVKKQRKITPRVEQVTFTI